MIHVCPQKSPAAIVTDMSVRAYLCVRVRECMYFQEDSNKIVGTDMLFEYLSFYI